MFIVLFLYPLFNFDQICYFSRSREHKNTSSSGRRHKKPYKYWDVPAAGYENVTPMQYKAMQGKYLFEVFDFMFKFYALARQAVV